MGRQDAGRFDRRRRLGGQTRYHDARTHRHLGLVVWRLRNAHGAGDFRPVACGLAMYGPTELDWSIAEANPGPQAYWRRLIGDNTTEAGRTLLKKISPFHYAESFAKPALIAQGGKDAIVPQNQADRFVAELQKYKKPVTYLLYPDEPHDFIRAENWVSLFAIAERFFHDHLGGRYEPIGNDLAVRVWKRAQAAN